MSGFLIGPCGVAPAVVGGGFTPASLSNLIGWYKADVGAWQDIAGTSAATNATNVKRWDDQSGAGHNLLGDASTTTNSYATAALNGLPTINPIGALAQPLQVSLTLATTTVLSVYGVFRHTIGAGSTNNNRFVSIIGNGQANDFGNTASCQFTLTGDTTVNLGQNSANIGGTIPIASGTWLQMGFVFDGANASTYKSGTIVGSGTADTNAFASPIGFALAAAFTSGGNSLTGGLGEVIVTNAALSGTDLSNLQSYLSGRWGV